MLQQLTPLLSHYASRINVSIATHPKGIQVMINIMPCPDKVSDESLRQQLIAPIVVAGDEQSVTEQLRGLKDLLGSALANDTLNASVEAYNAKINGATTTDKTPSSTKGKAKPSAAATTTPPPTSASPTASTGNDALSDFIA